MGSVIGALLPLAVGIAVSPVPIIAVILLLLAPRARAASLAFAVGWIVGIVLVVAVCTVLAATTGLNGSSGNPSKTSSWIKIALGILLLLLAVRQWRSQPAPGREAELPKWMATIDEIRPVQALALGGLLSALNPKNLLLGVAAGVEIGGAHLSTGESILAIAIFTVLAASTVLVPVVAYLVASDRLQGPLDHLKAWLIAHNAAVMAVLFLVLGVSLAGKGIGGL